MFARFFKNESGATAIEYGLIAALIAVAIITGVTAVGKQAGATFDKVSTTIETGIAEEDGGDDEG